MEGEKMDKGQKSPLESLSKDEIIQKYKGLLAIAKKAKQAKDEIFEENRCLKEQLQQNDTQKEADKKALMTMKEMLEAYTENKLQLANQLAELQKTRKLDSENLEKLSIENESLKRQLQRLTNDNESLLIDVENMEGQLKQVSDKCKDQQQQIVLLEQEIGQLKAVELKGQEIQLRNDTLCRELQDLKEKYRFVKDITVEQKHKFNSLKERFIEVHKKLKKLKECKRILLETQHEYADAVSQWQTEIIKASRILCNELNSLRQENAILSQKSNINQPKENIEVTATIPLHKLNELLKLSEMAKNDYRNLQNECASLKKNRNVETTGTSVGSWENCVEKLAEMWQLSESVCQEYNAMQNEIIMLKTQNPKSESQFDTSVENFEKCYINVSELAELQSLANKVSEDYKNQTLEITTLKESIEKLKEENACSNTNAEKLQKAQDSLKHYQNECDQLTQKINLLQEEKKFFENQIYKLENMKLQEESLNKELSAKFTSLEQNHLEDEQRLETLNHELQNVTAKSFYVKEKLQELDETDDEPPQTMSDLKAQFLATQQLLAEYQQKCKHKEIEQCELINEMREMNEFLKARGDLISRQQEEQQILKAELKANSEKLCRIQQEIDEKDCQLNGKQTELEIITKEVAVTKRKLENLENVNTLNEDKVRALTIELDNLKSDPSTSSADFDNKSDILSTSTISRADELQRLKDVEESFEDKYNKLRGWAAKLKKKLQEETVLKQRLEKEVQDLKKQEKDLNTQIAEFKSKILVMDSLHKQLNEKQKQIDGLKTENHKLKSSRKQANVLNLEIEAAEKSLTELTNKLTNRTLELEAVQETLKSKDSTIVQLRKEIDLLESSKASEVKHSLELKQQVDHLHKAIKDEVHSKQLAYDKSKLLEQDVENLKLELENVKIEMARSTSNHELTLNSLKHERDQLSAHLSTTQTALSDCEQKLKRAERATEDLRVEYLDYKIKAQAVLRKNQNRDSSKERELEEELLALRATETRLNTTMQTLILKVESLEKEKDLLNDDNTSLQKRSRELISLVEDMRAQNDALNQEIQQHIQQQHETLKQQRQQIESINHCHNEQILSLNASHQRQLEQLRKEISQQTCLPTAVAAAGKSTVLPPHAHVDHSMDQGKLDYLLMEREDAEGSEEAAESLANLAASRKISNDFTSTKRSMQDFMPLDELLNTPFNAINSETLITSSQQHPYTSEAAFNAGNSADIIQMELNSTKERLQKQESRVRHLTALLAENEQDLAKLTQMNDMLKEELRRQERSVEREQHLHNSEYVKNVILKFLTLNNADEKTRLVPVLNTILKLSRSETEVLNSVAKGQKVSENTQRPGGWSNFLSWNNNSIN